MSQALPIFLRAKRGKQTVFVVAKPSDTVATMKLRLEDINKVPADRIRIFASDKTKVYEDDSTVADHLLEDNNVVYFVYKKDGSDTFEEIAVTDTSDDGAAAAVDAGKK